MKTWQAVLLCVFAPTLLALIWLLNAPATKGIALVNAATNTNKMLANYEWFYESSEAFNARSKQIFSQKKMMAAETDPVERRRLLMELSATQQLCRDLAAKYLAKTGQFHVGYLKGKSLPESLNSEQCE